MKNLTPQQQQEVLNFIEFLHTKNKKIETPTPEKNQYLFMKQLNNGLVVLIVALGIYLIIKSTLRDLQLNEI